MAPPVGTYKRFKDCLLYSFLLVEWTRIEIANITLSFVPKSWLFAGFQFVWDFIGYTPYKIWLRYFVSDKKRVTNKRFEKDHWWKIHSRPAFGWQRPKVTNRRRAYTLQKIWAYFLPKNMQLRFIIIELNFAEDFGLSFT